MDLLQLLFDMKKDPQRLDAYKFEQLNLTAAEIGIIDEACRSFFNEKWMKFPADRDELKELVSSAYAACKFPAPEFVFQLDSPRAAVIAATFLSKPESVQSLMTGYALKVFARLKEQHGASELPRISTNVCTHLNDYKPATYPVSKQDEINRAIRCGSVGTPLEGIDPHRMTTFFMNVNSCIWSQIRSDIMAQTHKLISKPVTNKEVAKRLHWDIIYRAQGAHIFGGLAPAKNPLMRVVYAKLSSQEPSALVELFSRVGAFWSFPNVCIVSANPVSLTLDQNHRLHSDSGACIEYPDGWRVFAWHGVQVPETIIRSPRKITVSRINGEQNAEIRRVLLELYGWERYIYDSGAELIDEKADQFGRPIRLYRQRLRNDEPLVMVEVTNPTPDIIDGDTSHKTYSLRVPPHMVNAQEAIAWTFGETAKTYKPDVET